MIEESYFLATLPKALSAGGGRILAADVHSLGTIGKRKRPELALAIDGHSVNLYDIKSSKLVTSYAVSPLTDFTCPPCSIRYPSTSGSSSRRLTYCSTTSPTGTLQCFQQSVALDYEVTKSSISVRTSTSPIVHLDAFQETGDSQRTSRVNLLAIHEDGEVRCYSENLEKELWSTRICTASEDVSSTGCLRIENASIMRLDRARKTLLKDRDDLIATITGAYELDAINVLVLFTRPPAGKNRPLTLRVMRIVRVDAAQEGLQASKGKPLQEIALSVIPEPAHVREEESHLSFHSSSGTLYQSSRNNLMIYKVLGMLTFLTKDARMDLDNISACLRISPSLVMLNTAAKLVLLDSQYSSVQSQRSLESTLQAESTITSKKKQKHIATPPSARLLSFFPSLKILVALQGRQLVGFQLTVSEARDTKPRKRKRDGLLIDSIGRGNLLAKRTKSKPIIAKDHHTFGQPLGLYPIDDDWEKTKKDLDRCFAERKYEEIESILDKQLAATRHDVKQVPEAGLEDQPSTVSRGGRDQSQIDYLLSTIFSVKADHAYSTIDGKDIQKDLRINGLPQRLCSWLIEHKSLSTGQIEAALRRKRLLAHSEHLGVGAVFEALAQQDPSLETALLLLRSAAPLTASEVACALRISIAQSSASSTAKLLTYGQSPSHSSANDTGTYPRYEHSDLQDTPKSSPPLNDRGHTAHAVLLACITRLHRHSTHTISTVFKTHLCRPELHTLVDLLRMELASSGWLASPIDFPVPFAGTPQLSDPTPVSLIAHVLNSAIDSLGTGGWLSRPALTSSYDTLTEASETISHLKIEISAALEGIMEATYLQGLLNEMLLCGRNFGSTKSKMQEVPVAKVLVKRKHSDIVKVGVEEDVVLPLGLRPEQMISTHKVGAGGEIIRRSKREIGRLKSRMLPKYSFEQIFI